MIPTHCTASDVGWRDIPIGAFFSVVHTGACTEKAVGKIYRKLTADTGVDVDAARPPTEIFFEPSTRGYNILTANISTEFPEARELTSHRVNGLNEALRIFVLDYPGHGGACRDYTVLVPCDPNTAAVWAEELMHWTRWSLTKEDALLLMDSERHRACIQRTTEKGGSRKPTVYLEFFDAISMAFQNGPIKESGINGISQEALIAVLIDRLEGFQSGQFQCHDNQVALDSLQNARLWLHKRTMDRVARQVEGTTNV